MRSSQLLFDADGTPIQRRRKITPTYHERMIWGQGDGSGLRAVDSAVGRIGQLACWEHYLPLARYALIADGEQIHAVMYPAPSAASCSPTRSRSTSASMRWNRPASWSTPPPGSIPTSRRRLPRTPAAPPVRSPTASSPPSSIPKAASSASRSHPAKAKSSPTWTSHRSTCASA
ncbi:nitrilase-related carbon-nitrogen hydrolase [Streptomyces sp. NPDC055681]